MTSPAAEAAHSAINIAERYMSQQQMSIDRQRELVASSSVTASRYERQKARQL
jgi:hypothetical protein